MANKMTHGVRAELANAVRRRYGSAAGREKRKILDEFVATTGYHEKSAIRVLNAQPAVIHRQRAPLSIVGSQNLWTPPTLRFSKPFPPLG
jgi:hypothetical protein